MVSIGDPKIPANCYLSHKKLEHTQEAENFIKTVDQKILLLADFPHIGIKSDNNPLIQQLLLTKHNKINYIIENDIIKVLDIIDTRQQNR